MTDNNSSGEPAVDTEVLACVDEAKRLSLLKLIVGTAYAVPAIASFSLAGLSVAEAANYAGNL